MADQIKVEIVTPEKVSFSDEVDMVTLPGVEGEIGIYPNHVPLMTQVAAGEVAIKKSGESTFLAVGGGFVKVTGDHVAILTEMAIEAGEIDEAAAEEARRKAEQRLKEKQLTDEQIAAENLVIAHARAQLDVKKRRRPESL